MSTHIYARARVGERWDVRVLDLAKEARAVLSGNTFSVKATDIVVTIIATPDLTGGEATTLDTCVSDHKAAEVLWPPLSYNGLKINNVASTSYTFEREDEWRYTRFGHADPIAATIPPYSDVPFPLGVALPYEQVLAGKVTLVQGSGVTILSTERTTVKAGKGAAIVHVALNLWSPHGALEE